MDDYTLPEDAKEIKMPFDTSNRDGEYDEPEEEEDEIEEPETIWNLHKVLTGNRDMT